MTDKSVAAWLAGGMGLILTLAIGCSSGGDEDRIRIDGSSTVEPISSAVAEKFQMQNPRIKIPVGTSGTGGGFKKFLAGETDINDASRPIKESEIERAKKEGIQYVELKVAIDGLTVVVHPENTWCDALTVEALKKLWEPNSQITTWKQLGEVMGKSDWPDEKIKLSGPGTDSGTFDYFTEEICGKKGASRPDYSASENDNDIVRDVAGNQYALGYFGFAYYVENKDKLKAVKIVPPGKKLAEAVAPTPETVEKGLYRPLSRPLFIYVNLKSLQRPAVQKFCRYYLSDEAQQLVKKVGYVPLSQKELAASRKRLEDAIKGLSSGT